MFFLDIIIGHNLKQYSLYNQLSIYYLNNGEYKQVNNSILLPELDINLLVKCVNLPSRPQAKKMFMKGLE